MRALRNKRSTLVLFSFTKVLYGALVLLLFLSNAISKAQTIESIEYFIGSDLGLGNGTIVAATANTGTILSQDIAIPLIGLPSGFHKVTLRAKDNTGAWSLYGQNTFYISASTSGSDPIANIVGAEYWFDTDPGPGGGTPLTISGTPSETEQSFVIPLGVGALEVGFHRIGLRVQNEDLTWSLYDQNTFYISASTSGSDPIANIVGAEYWFDNDPGLGGGTPLTISGTPSETEQSFVIPLGVGALEVGFHRIGLRVQNEDLTWSLYDQNTFYISEPIAGVDPISNIAGAEYWFDTDPGPGGGTPLTISGTPSETEQSFVIPLGVGALEVGFHRLGLRVQNLDGTWSLYDQNTFYISDPFSVSDAVSDLVAVEYYFDTDPGLGSGTSFALTGDPSETIENLVIPLGDLEGGYHQLVLRAQNTDGIWGIYDTKTFYVIDNSLFETGPLSQLDGVEYLFDEDLGYGTGTVIELTATGNPDEYTISIPTGTETCNIHDISLALKNAGGDYSQPKLLENIDISDGADPTIVVFENIIVELDESGQGSLTIIDIDNGTYDDCELVSVILNQAQFDYTTADLGPNVVTITATDAESKISTLDVTVTVIENGGGSIMVWYQDFDGDTYGNPSVSQIVNNQPAGYVSNNLDCNDTDITINPNTIWYADIDGDGFGDATTSTTQCLQPDNYVLDNTDCDDSEVLINPDTVWYMDSDGDDYAVSSITQCANPGPGYNLTASLGSDCNDENSSVNPGATENADNGIDENCDGFDLKTWYADLDGDTYGDVATSQIANEKPANYVLDNTDCDDTPILGATIYPGAPEVADNGIDENCDGFDLKTWYADADGDLYGNALVNQTANEQPTNYVLDKTDCDDTPILGATIYPGAPELADNGIDENCDGFDLKTWYADLDGDNYGDVATSQTANTEPANYVLDSTDCDDTPVLGATIYPGAPEVADNGIDEDCDGLDLKTWYADSDGDTYGDPSVNQTANTQPTNYVSNNTDCDDTPVLGATIYPGAPEVADNGIDEDCDGLDLKTWYADADADGFGDIVVSQTANTEPANYVLDSTDCDDTPISGAIIYPGAPEVADNGIDEDCDGLDLKTWYADSDGDTYGDPSVNQTANTQPTNYVSNNTDCDDTPIAGATIYPGAPEVADNGIDEDCDGLDLKTWYADLDGDTYGDPSVNQTANTKPENYVSDNTDCDDTPILGATIYPGAAEVADNGIDEDCDGLDLKTWYADSDGDTYGDPSVNQTANTQPTNYVSNNTDCNDNDVSINPDTVWFADTDGDGFGDAGTSTQSCDKPTAYVLDSTDCNDNDFNINPDTVWFADTDGDGFGDSGTNTQSCNQPIGYVIDNTDCNDNDVNINPGVTEILDNGIDDDCNLDTLDTIVPEVIANIAGAEYWFDTDPGPGGGTALAITGNPNETTESFAISLGSLEVGFHRLGLRVQNLTGQWSLYDQNTFYISEPTTGSDPIANIVGAEYWFDNDPGPGGGTPLTISGTPSEAEQSFVIPLGVGALEVGFHRIGLRVQNEDLTWSLYDQNTFYISEPIAGVDPISNIAGAEYWFDNDPGPGGGMPLTISGTPSETEQSFVIPLGVGALEVGFHRIGLRVQNLDGTWSLYDQNTFYISDPFSVSDTVLDLVAVEYYFDTDPGLGSGTSIALSGSPNETIENLVIPITGLEGGYHQLVLRAQNTDGIWGIYDTKTFYVIDNSKFETGPLSQLVGVEYLFDAELGYGTGTVIPLTSTNNPENPDEYTISIPTGTVACSIHDISLALKNAGDDYSQPRLLENIDISDGADPTIVVFENIIVELDESGQGSLTIVDVDNGTYDDCELVSVVLSQLQYDYTISDIGTSNTVNVIATDGEGKISNLEVPITVLGDGGSLTTWYLDADNDGYGDSEISQTAVNQPAGYVSNNLDCDDTPISGATIYPGATEILDNDVDEDCDGFDLKTWYADTDGDLYGNPSVSQTANEQPTTYVLDSTDCNDNDVLINPETVWYLDKDSDGFGDATLSTTQCLGQESYVLDNTDCNDNDGNINPNTVWFADTDGDGFGNAGTSTQSCDQPLGYVIDNADCNDSNSAINPGMIEIINNGVDDDCNAETLDNPVLQTDYFITTWRTTTANESITIPTTGAGYNYTVDWGDGTVPTVETGNATHNYAFSGDYQVEITGDFPRIYFTNSGDKDKILSVDNWGSNPWTSMASAFWECTNLVINSIDAPDLSNVSIMANMFNGATSFNQDISHWDVSNVSNFNYLFRGATSFNQPIGNWDISGATQIGGMFLEASSFNQNISSWDVRNVIYFQQLFMRASSFNQDLSTWDVTNALNTFDMFMQATSFNQDISNWNVGNVEYMNGMFSQATSFNQNIGGWQVGNVTDMSNMFSGVTLSTTNYDNLLTGWAGQTLQPNVTFDAGNSIYCSSTAIDARANMIASDGWSITDGGSCFTLDLATLLDVNAECEATPTAPTANGGNITATTDTTFPITTQGTTIVTWSYDDGNGNTVEQTQSIIINDTTPPEIFCPETIVVSTDAGVCEANVIITPPTVTDNCGGIGNALNFDGVDDFIDLGSPLLSASSGSQAHTVEMWVKTNPKNAYTILFNQYGYDQLFEYRSVFYINTTLNGGNLVFFKGSYVNLQGTTNLLDNNWHHVAMVKESSGILSLYVDGIVEAVGLDTYAYSNTNSLLGGQTLLPDNYYNGVMDEVRIWNTAKTQSEIISSSNKILSGSESDLAAYYKFEDGIGSNTLMDYSIHENTGSLTNMDSATVWVALNSPITPVILINDITGTNDASGLYPLGDTPVIWTATDANGNTNTCTQIITVEDNEGPIAIAQDVTVELDENGQVTITAEDIDNGSSDACGDVTLALSQYDFSCNDVGEGDGNCSSYLNFNNSRTTTNIPVAILPETNFTIEYWFKTSDVNAGLFQVLNSLDEGHYDRDMYLDNGQLRTRMYSANEPMLSSTSGLNDGDWHHVSWTVESGVGQNLYVDGVLSASGNSSISNFDWGDSFHLGFAYLASSLTNSGGMDEFRFWNRVLDVSELDANRANCLNGDEQGLLVYYDFESDGNGAYANKAIGGNYDVATINSTSVNTSGGPLGGIGAASANANNFALDFDGIDNYASLTNIGLGLQGLTLQAWIKTISNVSDAAYEGNPTHAILGDHTNDIGMSFGVDGGKIEYNSFNGSTWNSITSVANVNDGNWHQVSVTHQSNGTATIYIDGVEDASQNISFTNNTKHTRYDAIGASYLDGVNYGAFFLGEIDEVRTWATPLLAADILANYNQTLTGSQNGMMASYNFDEGSGTVLNDQYTNNLHGVLHNFSDPSDWVDGTSGLTRNEVLITLTVTDIHDNESTATANVTVVDKLPPTVFGKDIEVTLTASGTISIIASDVLDSGSDNCGSVSYSISQDTFEAQDAIVSPVTIQLTGTDPSGNETTVPVEVTVREYLATNWGIVGSAINNWGEDGPDLPFYKTDVDNVLVAYVTLADGEIKFRENNDWINSYGDTGADGTLEVEGAADILVSAGTYKIVMNLDALTYTMENFTWGLVGDNINNWGNDGDDIPLTYDATGKWSTVVTLTNGWLKFRLNNDWSQRPISINYGDFDADGILDETPDNNIYFSAGLYLVTVDFNTLEYSFEPIVHIPDENFEQALIDIGVDTDGIINHLILRSDALAVTDLQLTNPINNVQFGNPLIQPTTGKIADLTGVEAFTNITKLGLSYSDLASVNLTYNIQLDDLFLSDNLLTGIDISKNTLLTRFGVMRNPNIGVVDISKNTLLKELFLENTGVTTIDLTNNLDLWKIRLENNNLTGIDVSLNTKLTDFNVRYNASLTYLDMRNGNNKNITNIDLRDTSVSCINADGIAVPDVSAIMFQYYETKLSIDCGTIYIPDPNFEQALIDQGLDGEIGDPIDHLILQNDAEAITHIYIADKGINNLIGIEAFINLEVIEADMNNIEMVNLSNNTKLTQCHLNQNNLTSIDFSNNLFLEQVGLGSNDLTEMDLSLQDVLTTIDFGANVNLTSLNLRNGNNVDLSYFSHSNVPSLTCITADDLISEVMTNSGLYFNSDCNNDLFTLAGRWKVAPEPNSLVVGSANDRTNIWWANDAQYVADWTCYFDDEYVFNADGSFQNVLGTETLINGWQGEPGCGTPVSPHDGTADASYIFNQNTGTITLNGIGAYLVLPKANNQGELPNVPVPSSIIHNVSLSDNNNVMTVELFVGSGTLWTYKLISDKVVYIPDANFETYLETHDTDGGEVALGDPTSIGDGFINNLILKSKAESVTGELNVYGRGISDLTGIESFVNIIELNVGENNITQIDLSQNAELKLLWVWKNGLKELDVSNNLNLERISAGSNQISKLNVTGLESLHTIIIWGNQLSSIDVSTNIGLIQLEAQTNQLAYIDLTSNSELDRLGIGGNLFNSTIDLTQNKKLTSFDANTNQLKSLDLSENTELELLVLGANELEGLDLYRNTKLTEVNVPNNLITKINVFTCTDLFKLNAVNNLLTSLDVSNNPNLKILGVKNNLVLESLDMRNGNNGIVEILNAYQTPSLNCINADAIISPAMTQAGLDFGKTFSEDCGDFVYIPDPNFEQALIDLGIDSDGVVNTSVLREDAELVTTLDVSDPVNNENLLNVDAKIQDLTGIEAFTGLVNLYAWDNSIEGILDVSQNTLLEHISISDNNISNIDLTTNEALKEVYFNDNAVVTFTLGIHPFLEHIHGGGNQLNSINLSNSPALRSLILWGSNLTELNTESNIALRELVLDDNGLTTLDVSNNPSLEFIALGNNQLTSLNVANGNNANFTHPSWAEFSLYTLGNGDLECIQVDPEIVYNVPADWAKDGTAIYTSDCATKPEYVHIPDSNFEQALIDLNIDSDRDKEVNSWMLKSDAELVTTLDVSDPLNNENLSNVDAKIQDLTGIEAFTDLVNLYAWDNNVGALDVSHNTLLEHLSISDNNITELSLINNNELREVYFNNNTMSTFTLGSHQNLLNIHGGGNQLNSVHLSNSPSLSSLILWGSNLTEIDTQFNIDLVELVLDDNQLTSLDVSMNSMLEFIALGNNQLTSLNIANSNNANFTHPSWADFSLYTLGNEDLECIQVDAEIVHNVPADWAKDGTAIYTSDCATKPEYVHIPDENFEQALIDLNIDSDLDKEVNSWLLISDAELVATLDISDPVNNENLFNVDAKIQDLIGIEAFTILKELRADNNNLSALNVSQNITLEKVYISDNRITDLSFITNPALVEVEAERNELLSIDVLNNPLLKVLYLDENSLGSIDISNNIVLEDINVSNNQILALDIAVNQNVVTLDASNNLDLVLTTDAILGSPTLTTLNLSSTGLSTYNGASYPNLKTLSLNDNNLNKFNANNSLLLEKLFLNENDINKLTLSPLVQLIEMEVSDNVLVELDVRNGENSQLTKFSAVNNALLCASVDDPNDASVPWEFDFGVVLSANCKAEPETVLILDPIFEQVLIDEGVDLDGIGLNGSILLSDALATIELNLYLSGITNMTGIEAFENLEILNASFNNFDEIDLSNCTKLIDVDLTFNNLTNLTLTSGKVLTQLKASGNDLTALNLEDLINLTHVDLSFNEFESLNASGLDQLIMFNVSNNSLLELDIRNGNNVAISSFSAVGNPNLGCIGVDDVNNIPGGWDKDVDTHYTNSGDCSPPTVITQNITVELDGNGLATINPADIDDGSTDNTTTSGKLLFSLDQTDFSCGADVENSPIEVTLYVEDEFGNESSATAEVTVVDITPPVASAKRNFELDLNGEASVDLFPINIDDGSSDNCGTPTLSIDQNLFYFPGTKTVVLTATDASGNISTDETTVEVIDSSVGSQELKFGKLKLTVTVFPVPFTDEIKMSFSKPIDDLDTVIVTLFDNSGVNTEVEFTREGESYVSISTSSLEVGTTYILQIEVGSDSKTTQIIKTP